MHHGPSGRQSCLLIVFLLFVFLLSDATTQSIITQSCDVVNGTVRDLTTTLLGESRRLSRAHVHDHVQRIGIRSDGGKCIRTPVVISMNPPAVSMTEWFLSSMTSEIAHRGRMTSAHWKFAVAARPSQESDHLIFIFAESGNWYSACAVERAPSFRRLRLHHSDPWNVEKEVPSSQLYQRS